MRPVDEMFAAAFHFAVAPTGTDNPSNDLFQHSKEQEDILKLSRGVRRLFLVALRPTDLRV